jgi:hypothetical protein
MGMLWLKQSTAKTVKMGPFLDDTDGKTAETGLTIAQADIRLTKNGGDFAQTNNSAGATHDENGYYDVPLDTTDTNTLGTLRVAISKSGALPVWQDFMVVTANFWDSLCGTDVLDASVVQWNGINVATPDTAGYPKVTLKSGTGTGEINLSSGNLAGSVASVTGAVGSVTGAVASVTAGVNLADNAITAAKIAADAITAAKVAADVSSEITDQIWDELLSGHAGVGSTGAALSAAGSAGDPWSTALPGAYGAGTAGKLMGDNLNATVSSRATQSSVDTIDDYLDTEIAAILADTNELQTDLVNGGRLDLLIDAIKAKTDGLNFTGTYIDAQVKGQDNIDFGATQKASLNAATPASITGAVGSVTGNVGGNVTGSIGSLAAQAKTDVNDQVVDALGTDTLIELSQAAPPATPTIKQALMLLYMALRNETNTTSALLSIKNDAGTVICKATLSDDATTFTKAELVSGP